MIVRSVRGNREFRSGEFGSSAIPPPGSGYTSFSGIPVTSDRTFGLPAVMAAIRLIAEVTAAMDICVYRGVGGDKKTAEDSWQDKLMDQPNVEQSQFDWLSDVSAGVEGYGNSFVEKIKFRNEVVELIPRDPDYVRVRREGNRKVFDVSVDGRTRTNLTPSTILHFRGFAVTGYLSGFSPITMYRQALGTALALQEFQGRYFANDATPSGAIVMPGSTTKTRALEILDLWKASHGGVSNAGNPAILSGGSTYEKIGVSLVDAQFVEAQRFSLEQVADMFRVPSDLIGGPVERGVAATAEQVGLRFLVFYLLPRLRRIELALDADLDLFANTDVYPKFTTDDLLRADALTKAQVQHYQIQDGTLLVDEARAEDGKGPLPPIPADPSLTPGMVPQITPVGGAPNDPLTASPNGSTA
jgi:HK97 family phage portal protein